MLASEEAVKESNLKPLARLVAYSAVGVPPEIMGIGPVPAIQNVLKVAGLTLNDIDLVEVRIQISQFRLPRQAYISKSILFVFHRLTKHSVCKHWLVQNRLVWI